MISPYYRLFVAHPQLLFRSQRWSNSTPPGDSTEKKTDWIWTSAWKPWERRQHSWSMHLLHLGGSCVSVGLLSGVRGMDQKLSKAMIYIYSLRDEHPFIYIYPDLSWFISLTLTLMLTRGLHGFSTIFLLGFDTSDFGPILPGVLMPVWRAHCAAGSKNGWVSASLAQEKHVNSCIDHPNWSPQCSSKDGLVKGRNLPLLLEQSKSGVTSTVQFLARGRWWKYQWYPTSPEMCCWYLLIVDSLEDILYHPGENSWHMLTLGSPRA